MILRLSRSTRAEEWESSSAPSAAATFTIRTSDTVTTITPAPTLELRLSTRTDTAVELRRPARRAAPARRRPEPTAAAVLTFELPPPRIEPEPHAEPAGQPMSQLRDHSHRIELIIDSLPRHTLIEPIPVVIDPLGSDVFIATVRDVGVSATGTGIGEALLMLKEQIDFFYEDLRSRPKLGDEQKQQLQMLQTYISRPTARTAWVYGNPPQPAVDQDGTRLGPSPAGGR